MFLNNLEFSKIMKTAKNRLLRDLKSYKVGTMSSKSIFFTADQKLNKWDFINDDSAKNMQHERIKIPNKKTEHDEKTDNCFDQSQEKSMAATANEKKTTISKFSEKLRQKMKRSKSRDTLSSSNSSSSNSTDLNFEPPPAARPSKPEVKSKPVSDITDINFSGIVGSNTVLRQHCEQCVLRNKPEDFRSVLFVCQL